MRWMFVKGRLKPGVTPEQAHANVSLIGRQLADANPQTNKDRRMSAVPTTEVRLLVPQASGIMSMGAAGLMSVVGSRAPHRLRERRRHAAGACLCAPTRNQRPPRDWRQPRRV